MRTANQRHIRTTALCTSNNNTPNNDDSVLTLSVWLAPALVGEPLTGVDETETGGGTEGEEDRKEKDEWGDIGGVEGDEAGEWYGGLLPVPLAEAVDGEGDTCRKGEPNIDENDLLARTGCGVVAEDDDELLLLLRVELRLVSWNCCE